MKTMMTMSRLWSLAINTHCDDLRPPLYPGYPYPSLGMEQLAAWHRNPYSIPLSSAPGSPMARYKIMFSSL